MDGLPLDGRVLARGEDGYEQARRASVWHARVPERYPDLIVGAAGEADVVAAVRFAGERSMQIGIRSGGHSWAANHLRDGGLLLDMSRIDAVTIDGESLTATAGPGRKGDELSGMLGAEGLFFPSGHCRGVGLGGYLLQGGYGWNSRAIGVACQSVIGLDVVTADGELRHIDEDNDPDLYWAARGSGPGFFGVVTRFHLRVYKMPAVVGISAYLYPMELLDEVFTWAHEIGSQVDRRVEMQILVSRAFSGAGIEEPAIAIGSPVFADSEEEARDAVAIFETCPVRDRALMAVPYMETTLADWYDIVMGNFPSPPRRFCTDNMWTSAPIADLLPGLHAIVDSMPPPPAHALWLNWCPSASLEDMAYSLEDDFYIALYGEWDRAEDDAKYSDWARSNMASMAPLASGIQLADENLGERWASFVTDENMQRLDRIRAAYDPLGRFHSWMGR